MTIAIIAALACAALALLYGIWSITWIVAQPAGNERMREIAAAVQQGARAYLNRQYTTIGIVGVVLFVVIGVIPALGWPTAFGFLIGAVLSGAAGYAGMLVSVRANVRTAQAATRSLAEGLSMAFRAGALSALITNVWGGAIEEISLTTGKQIRTASIGDNPGFVNISQNHAFAYVVRPFGEPVSVLDTSTLAIKQTLAVGSGPSVVTVCHPPTLIGSLVQLIASERR